MVAEPSSSTDLFAGLTGVDLVGALKQLCQGSLCALIPNDQKCSFDLPSFPTADAAIQSAPLLASGAVAALLLVGIAAGASSSGGATVDAAAIYAGQRYNASEAERYFRARPALVFARSAEILLNRSRCRG